ncbi:chorion class CA protein ERA.2-like [Bombyx mandarina]|uniref:Chorion class CA protein ERA.2-like n=1 Tax=Bombyx mandarina TaxID=7092 RepID=A0A6J2JH52_BOMMA|nr:chorion class CA protein ERA.2-like [Bombyx mandarina]
MSNLIIYYLCIQVLLQTVYGQCLGREDYSGNHIGTCIAPLGGSDYGPVCYGGSRKYGGSGLGSLAIAGELPVAGAATVGGHVPVIGVVEFGGRARATGVIFIIGHCFPACRCGGASIFD